MNAMLKIAAGALVALSLPAAAQVVFYEHDGFAGRSFETNRQVGNFERFGFNDRASSVVVISGRWEMCTDARFGGQCVVVRPGRYPTLNALGLNDRLSSVRPVGRQARVEERRFAPPPPMPVYDNRRRQGERLFEAEVTSVRAVYGSPRERCWVEREQVGDRDSSIAGAVVGGLIGGVLGHQIGSGRGNDAATAGGAIAGAVIGSNVARDRDGGYVQDVRRCESVQGRGRPEFWDVTYVFRGVEHRMQTAHPPGRTVTVNQRGEPRA